MKTQSEVQTTSPIILNPSRWSYWRKIGGGSLMISLAIHSIVVVAGLVWVFNVIPEPEREDVSFVPRSVGRSSATEVSAEKAHAKLAAPSLNRTIAFGAVSSVSLPDPELTTMSALSGISIDGLANAKLGNSAFKALGPNSNQGLSPNTLNQSGTKDLFGGKKANANALLGKLYDFKQTRSRKAVVHGENKAAEVVQEFVTSGWKDRVLADYFSPKQELYLTKFYIPRITADQAPAAFGCENEVQPQQIMMLYRGTVSPPKSGTYRFVGGGDNMLAVRFNNRNVFDHGYDIATVGKGIQFCLPYLKGRATDRDIMQLMKNLPMKPPVLFYQYDTTRVLNKDIGGLAVGPTFSATAGASYPIDILIVETSGVDFSAVLLIEEVGAKYAKASTGAPVLPLFRLDTSEPITKTGESAPPYDLNAPPWKLIRQGGRPEID